MNEETVSVWDLATASVTVIPRGELVEGMIEGQIPWHEGTVWFLPEEVPLVMIAHPPLEGSEAEVVGLIREAFLDVWDRSLDDWKDDFRWDENIHAELLKWLVAASVYKVVSKDRPQAFKVDAFHLLAACANDDGPGTLEVIGRGTMTEMEAGYIRGRYIAGVAKARIEPG